MRRLCGRGVTYSAHSEGPGTPPYGPYGPCAGSRLDGATQKRVAFASVVRGRWEGQGATRQNAAMER